MSADEYQISMAGGAGDPLDEIQRRADAAEGGPWYVDGEEQTVRAREYAGEIIYDRSIEHSSQWAEFRPTAEFIAHARTDVPFLLDLIRKQAAKLEAVDRLAIGWDLRGESDMAFSKTIPDPDIAIEILTNGAQMVENARHIRVALEPTP